MLLLTLNVTKRERLINKLKDNLIISIDFLADSCNFLWYLTMLVILLRN